jgi:hypothetical protein
LVEQHARCLMISNHGVGWPLHPHHLPPYNGSFPFHIHSYPSHLVVLNAKQSAMLQLITNQLQNGFNFKAVSFRSLVTKR